MRNNDNQRLFLTQRPQRAQSFISPCISRLCWSGRKLRYDKSAQRVLSTPLRPQPKDPQKLVQGPLPNPPLYGREWLLLTCAHQQNIILPSLVEGQGGGSVGAVAGEGSVLQKTLHPSVRGAGRGNPRIVNARSSQGISREHELPGA